MESSRLYKEKAKMNLAIIKQSKYRLIKKLIGKDDVAQVAVKHKPRDLSVDIDS